jgi:hypothetical protein
MQGELVMVEPVFWQCHDAPTNHKREFASWQIGFGVELLSERPAANAQLGGVDDAVAAEAVALALCPTALPLGDARAARRARLPPSQPALAGHPCKLHADAATGVHKLLVPFQPRVHRHCRRSRPPQLRALGVGVAACDLGGRAPLRRPWALWQPGGQSLCLHGSMPSSLPSWRGKVFSTFSEGGIFVGHPFKLVALKLVLVAVPVSRWQLIVISLWFCLLGWFMPLALHPFVV